MTCCDLNAIHLPHYLTSDLPPPLSPVTMLDGRCLGDVNFFRDNAAATVNIASWGAGGGKC